MPKIQPRYVVLAASVALSLWVGTPYASLSFFLSYYLLQVVLAVTCAVAAGPMNMAVNLERVIDWFNDALNTRTGGLLAGAAWALILWAISAPGYAREAVTVVLANTVFNLVRASVWPSGPAASGRA